MKEKLVKCISPTGKIHYGIVEPYIMRFKRVRPLCNHKEWIGDRSSKDWAIVPENSTVDCKRCLAQAVRDGIISNKNEEVDVKRVGDTVRITVGGTVLTSSMLISEKQAKKLTKKLDALFSPKVLTVGCRARFKTGTHYDETWGYGGKECLIQERSGGEFDVMILGQKELKRKDPNTVIGGIAWVGPEDLEFVDADLRKNMAFIDWYSEHEEDFCPDCGAWFPEQGRLDPETDEDVLCPNPECPGNKLAVWDYGFCPHCDPEIELKGGKCPKCGWDGNW